MVRNRGYLLLSASSTSEFLVFFLRRQSSLQLRQNSYTGSHRRFCCWSAATPLPSTSTFSHPQKTRSESFPDVIERDCKKWERIVLAEIETRKNMEKFTQIRLSSKLECTEVSTYKDGYVKLSISLQNLSPEEKEYLARYFPMGISVELYEDGHPTFAEERSTNGKQLIGVVISRSKTEMILRMWEDLTEEDFKAIKCKPFGIRKWAIKNILGSLDFLQSRASEWRQMPGFETMLHVYGLKSQKERKAPDDPVHLIKDTKEMAFDHSQQKALAAALNLERRIVAVHGPPGTGKSRLILECMRVFARQGKKVVLSNPMHQMLPLLRDYHQLTKRSDFIIFSGYDQELLTNSIGDQNLREFMASKILAPTQKNIFGVFKRREEKDELRIVCFPGSHTLLALFRKLDINFDVFLMDDANTMSELPTWEKILTLSPKVRLFGDSKGFANCNPRIDDFHVSLLKRLDRKFGEKVNFHLKRQYRSNPAILEWSKRVFYKKDAAEPDASVRNIRIEDFHKKAERAPNFITNPLVLVDISRLEGAWKPYMFEFDNFLFGNALLTATHMANLVRHGMSAGQVAYSNGFQRQLSLVRTFLESLFAGRPELIWKFPMGKPQTLFLGQQFEAVIKSSEVNAPHFRQELPHRFQLWNLEISRARRQFFFIEDGKALRTGTPEMRTLHDCFMTKGRIVGPNDLVPLQHGQFERIKKAIDIKDERRTHKLEKDEEKNSE